MTLREKVAMAIYHAAFQPSTLEEAQRKVPTPGWCWEKASEAQKQFCLKQADAAIAVQNNPALTMN